MVALMNARLVGERRALHHLRLALGQQHAPAEPPQLQRHKAAKKTTADHRCIVIRRRHSFTMNTLGQRVGTIPGTRSGSVEITCVMRKRSTKACCSSLLNRSQLVGMTKVSSPV